MGNRAVFSWLLLRVVAGLSPGFLVGGFVSPSSQVQPVYALKAVLWLLTKVPSKKIKIILIAFLSLLKWKCYHVRLKKMQPNILSLVVVFSFNSVSCVFWYLETIFLILLIFCTISHNVSGTYPPLSPFPVGQRIWMLSRRRIMKRDN